MISLSRLPNMQPGETSVLFLRRHWIDLLKIFLTTFFLLLVPVAIAIVIAFMGVDTATMPLVGPALRLALSAYLMIVVVVTMTEITDYWLDTWIVTTERIINIEQHGLFKRLVSEVPLEQVQDVTSETHGFLETFLTYGDVYIQTAGERVRFQFVNVDNPDQVKETIIKLWQTCSTQHHHERRAGQQK